MPNHRGIPIWEVEFPIAGKVTIDHNISLNMRKELHDPEAFYSEIKISQKDYGFSVKLTAFAPDSTQAQEAGLVFLGRMLDVLSVRISESLIVINQGYTIHQKVEPLAKRVLDFSDFSDAFREARKLSLGAPTFLRALGWFRKGKNTTDPLDRYLSFWNAIEIVASKYNPNPDICKKRGSICQVWECFKKIWGDCRDWPNIAGKDKWIDIGNKNRVNVAHGTIATDIESVNLIAKSLGELEVVSHQFLMDWRKILELNVDESLLD